MQRAALDKILLKLLLCSKIKLLLPPELCLKEAAQTLLEDPSGAGRFSCSSCGRPLSPPEHTSLGTPPRLQGQRIVSALQTCLRGAPRYF